MKYILTAVIASFCALGVTFVAWNYVPLDYITVTARNLGSTITTINGSDTLSNSRATINTNFSNLNTDKLESGSSALALSITNASTTRLSCLGDCAFGATATSSFSGAGALSLASALTVPNGGTGWVNIQSNTILLGNGTSRLATSSQGTNGQVWGWTNGAMGWVATSTSVSAGTTNTWTAHQIFTSLFSALATTTNATTTGSFYLTALSAGGLGVDSTGKVYSAATSTSAVRILLQDGATYSTSNTSTTTVKTLVLPANTMAANDSLEIEYYFYRTAGNTDKVHTNLAFGNGTATSTFVEAPTSECANALCSVKARIFNLNSTSSQRNNALAFANNGGTAVAASTTATTFDTTSQLYIGFQMQAENGADTASVQGITVKLIKP